MIAMFALGRPVFPNRDYANFAKESYQKNIIAYRCIELIASSAASVPWLLFNENGDEIEEHQLLDLFRRPNPMQSRTEYFESVYAFDLLAGNSYLERNTVDSGSRVQELYSLRPDRMKIVPGPLGLPARYEYTVNQNTKSFDVNPVNGACDILHVKKFNPLNDWYGQSPLEAMGMSVDSHNEATRWNYALLRNGARPSGGLEYEGTLEEDEFQRLKKEIEENYNKNRTGKPMLLQGGLKWVQMMLSQVDLDWAKGKEMSAREVALGYNVPEQLVGVPGQQTYNNYREARMALFEDAVLPLLDRYSAALTSWFNQLPEYQGLRIGYDEDRISALAPRRELIWDKVSKATWLTLDEKREATGYEKYEPEDKKPGSMIFVSAAEIPLQFAVDPGMGVDVPMTDEEGVALQPGATPAGGPVQDLALNGAQIQAVVDIVVQVVDKTLPPESAMQLLLVAFPSIDEATARLLIDPATEFEKPEPPPMPAVPPIAGQPGKPVRVPQTDEEKHVMQVVAWMTKRKEKILLRKAHKLAYGS